MVLFMTDGLRKRHNTIRIETVIVALNQKNIIVYIIYKIIFFHFSKVYSQIEVEPFYLNQQGTVCQLLLEHIKGCCWTELEHIHLGRARPCSANLDNTFSITCSFRLYCYNQGCKCRRHFPDRNPDISKNPLIPTKLDPNVKNSNGQNQESLK